LPEETAIKILENERGAGLEVECIEALVAMVRRGEVPESAPIEHAA
jgi:hypothetical protein